MSICPIQRSSVLGNKIEMEITELVEKNTSLLRLGLHLEFNDARHRIANHLQRNIDRSKYNLNGISFRYTLSNVGNERSRQHLFLGKFIYF